MYTAKAFELVTVENYLAGEKLQIPSLQNYLLIDSQKRFVTGYYLNKEQIWEERTWALGKGEVEFDCCGV